MTSGQKKTFLPCSRCNIATIQTALCAVDSDVEYMDADGHSGIEPATYTLFRCDGCTRISLYIHSAFNNPQSEFGEQAFPQTLNDIRGAPTTVQQAYFQAKHIKNTSQVAYAILARRVLDAIAQDKCPGERNLAQALQALAIRGEIPSFLADTMKHIRLFGNAAAHDAAFPISEIHVEMIDSFLEILINHLYVAPASLQEFKLLLGIAKENNSDIQ